jgi:predicted Zn-dependent protease
MSAAQTPVRLLPEPPPVSGFSPLALVPVPARGNQALGIAGADLHAPGLNFVFGIADIEGRYVKGPGFCAACRERVNRRISA